jgi:DNA-binding NtrC family response regulator
VEATPKREDNPAGPNFESPDNDPAGIPIPMAIEQNTSDGAPNTDWQQRFGQLEQVLGNLAKVIESRLQVRDSDATTGQAPDELSAIETAVNSGSGIPTLDQIEEKSREAETKVILAALQQTHWNRKKTAKLLQIDYKGLLYKLKKFQIGVPDNESGDERDVLPAG